MDWRNQIALLQRNGASESLLRDLAGLTRKLGWEQGQVRPDELGQWDVYLALRQDYGQSKLDAVLASGLRLEDVEKEEAGEMLRQQGYDPESPEDMAFYDQLKSMTSNERDATIKELEALLM